MTRTYQLFAIIGTPYLRTYSILSPEIVYQIKRRHWEDLCDHAREIKTINALQELSIQGGNDMLHPENMISHEADLTPLVEEALDLV